MNERKREKTRPQVKMELVIRWLCRIMAAVILGQTLFFKFTGAPESVYIFTQLGVEPWGRIGTGIFELIASVLLFVPRYEWLGAVTALGVISGALMSHLLWLGIVVRNDGGELFLLAVITWLCAAMTLFLYRRTIPWYGRWGRD